MADKLEWMRKHFVLMRYNTVQEAVGFEKYKLRPDLAQFVTADPMGSEEFVYELQERGKYKEACDFLSYIMHRRAAVWWGYNCMLSLAEELEINPAVERDIADIGAPKEMPIPDWVAPPEVQKQLAEEVEKQEQFLQKLEAEKEKMAQKTAELEAMIPPEIKGIWDEMYAELQKEFKKAHGVTFDELLTKAAEKEADKLFKVDPDSPIFKAAEKLNADIEAKRQETVDLIKSVLPPKMPEHQKKLRENAMQAVYRWVAAPDEGNSQAALEIGNECPDQPAGLLAMAAFWSYGNLTPEGEQVVQTPAGLAANGINSALLQAALHQGGTRKYMERCKHYLELGLQVIRGENVWDESLTQEETPLYRSDPFSRVRPEVKPAPSVPPPAVPAPSAAPVPPPGPPPAEPPRQEEPETPEEPRKFYKKWNPFR